MLCLNYVPSVAVAVTQLLWRPRGLLVDQFDSKEDLINAVFTSSFIPGWFVSIIYFIGCMRFFTCYKFLNKFKTNLYSRYLAPRPATMFRNRLCIDGGLTLFMPPTSAAQTVFLLFINLTIDYLLKPPFKCTGRFIIWLWFCTFYSFLLKCTFYYFTYMIMRYRSEGIFFLGRHFLFSSEKHLSRPNSEIILVCKEKMCIACTTCLVTSCEVSYKDWDG